MWCQLIPVAVPLKPAIHFPVTRKASLVMSQKPNTPYLTSISQTQQPLLSSTSTSSSVTSPSPIRALPIHPSPLLGLASLLFVLSTAFAALLSLAIFSIPTIKALKRLVISMEKLSVVVSREVPGTLLSFKLSSMEVNDLTKQLNSIRQMISATGMGSSLK